MFCMIGLAVAVLAVVVADKVLALPDVARAEELRRLFWGAGK
jgi:hypothetical protein